MAAYADDARPFQVTPTLPTIGDKTLVVWARPANTDQRGGSALTIERRETFDAVVFGELRPGCWMAGSDLFRRTQQDQSAYPVHPPGAATAPVRLAIAYEGNQVTLWRDDERVTRYTVGAAQSFGDQSTVLIGLRHLARRGAPNSHFAGTVFEARIYDRALADDEVHALRMDEAPERGLIGRWSFDDGTTRDSTGTFPDGTLEGGAFIENGALHLDGVDDFLRTPAGVTFPSPIHYRPKEGVFGDPIPFYWDGQYHVFYLQGGVGPVPWQHIVSEDLVHWRELPTALTVDGAPDGPDGGAMFTGSVMEAGGTFHIFYTGHNPNNPQGVEFVRHATSSDLIAWHKDPGFQVGPDGAIYATDGNRHWRDPYVFWNEEEQTYWMVVIATAADDRRDVQGLLASPDLTTWTPQPPLAGAPGQECPDLFRIGATWHLIGGGSTSWAEHPRGPYRQTASPLVDAPGVYAGKRMFDGARHIWVGWAWEAPSLEDRDPDRTWGGMMCLPRELYGGPGGLLCCKPAEEVVRAFSHTVLERSAEDGPFALPFRAGVPGDALITCVADFSPGAELTVAVREQADTGEAYPFTVRPSKSQIAIGTPQGEWTRDGCAIDAGRPVKIQVFAVGTMLECFVNDTYALTRRIYDHATGRLALEATGGEVTIRGLTVRVAE